MTQSFIIVNSTKGFSISMDGFDIFYRDATTGMFLTPRQMQERNKNIMRNLLAHGYFGRCEDNMCVIKRIQMAGNIKIVYRRK